MKKKLALTLSSAFALAVLTGCIDGFRPSALSPFPPRAQTQTTNENGLKPGQTFKEVPKQ